MVDQLPTSDDLFGPAQKPTSDDLFGPDPHAVIVPPSAGLTSRFHAIQQVQGDSIVKKMMDAFGESFGPEPAGLTPESIATLRQNGFFPSLDPKGGVDLIRSLNEAITVPLSALVDSVVRAGAAVPHALGAAAGEASKAVGADETTSAAINREVENAINFAAIDIPARGGLGQKMTKPEIDTQGRLTETHLGGLPSEGSFQDAATLQDTSPARIRQIYDERGVLPGETLHDAGTDVTITQDLGRDIVPGSYGGIYGPVLDAATPDEASAIAKSAGHDEVIQDVAGFRNAGLPAPLADRLALEDPIRAGRQAVNDANREMIAADAEVNRLKAEAAGDTRGQGQQYHGTSTPIEGDSVLDSYGDQGSIYGTGFYTTDATDIARGYAKKGRGGEPTIYAADINPDIKLLDLEKPFPETVQKVLDDIAENFDEPLTREDRLNGHSDHYSGVVGAARDELGGFEGRSAREIMDEIRAQSGSEGMSTGDVQELFDQLIQTAEKEGYRGFRHVGGKLTGKAAHEVNILWHGEDVKLRNLNPANAEKAAAIKAAEERAEAAFNKREDAKEELAKTEARKPSQELAKDNPPPVVGGGGSGGRTPPPRDRPELPAPEPQRLLAGPQAPRQPMSLDDANAALNDAIDRGNHDPKEPLTFSRLYTAWIDGLYPIKQAVKGAMKRIGGKLEIGEDPNVMFRLFKGTFGMAKRFIDSETVTFNGRRVDGRGLRKILEDVPSHTMTKFENYIVSKRVMELDERGIEHGVNSDAARTIVEHGDANPEFQRLHKELIGFQNRVAAYLRDSGVLSQKAFEAMVNANQNYVPFFRLLDPDLQLAKQAGRQGKVGLGSHNPFDIIYGSDKKIISPLESILKNTYAYIALADKNHAGLSLVDLLKRSDQGATAIRELIPNEENLQASLRSFEQIEGPKQKLLEGSTEGEVLPPDKKLTGPSSPRNQVVSRDAAGLPAELGEQVHGPDIIDAEFETVMDEAGIPNDPDLRVVIRNANRTTEGESLVVFRNGRREAYRTADPELVRAWRGLDSGTRDYLKGILQVPARLLRAGATLTPDFAARNVIRDFFTALVNSKGIFTPIDTLGGFKARITKDMNYRNWLSSGGANGALVSVDRRYMQDNLRELNDQTGLFYKSWNVVRHPIDSMRALSEIGDEATRIAEFKKTASVERLAKSDADITTDNFYLGTQIERDRVRGTMLREGGYRAREATIDFARMGSQTQALNSIIPFLNATLAEPDRLIRAFKDKPVGTTIKIIAGIMLPSAILHYYNMQDPRYVRLAQWQKDLFWVIPTNKWVPRHADEVVTTPDYELRMHDGQLERNEGAIFRLPKPFGLGVLFGSGMERSMDAFKASQTGQEWTKAYQHFGDDLMNALLPNVVPQIAVPSLQQATNTNFSGNALIPGYLEGKLPEYQYTPYTTELAKAVGKALGAFPGMEKLQQGGGMGAGVANALTSPILLENYLQNWTGGLGMYVLQSVDAGLRKTGVLPDDAVKPLSTLADIPFVRAFVLRYPTANVQSISDFYDRNAYNAMVADTITQQVNAGNVENVQDLQTIYGNRPKLNDIQKTLGTLSATIQMINADKKNYTPEAKRQLIDSAYYQMNTISEAGVKMLDEIDNAVAEIQKRDRELAAEAEQGPKPQAADTGGKVDAPVLK